jgi:DNA-binding PucR family transcriptional regulator
VWAWLGGETPLERGQRLRVPATARIALGRDAAGTDGFRASHEQASRAYGVARMGDGAVTTFDDVALEVLMASDPPAATAFVRDELGALTGDDERSQTLRATLRAWFATGHNAAAAAARLGVHEQTVAARLRVIEEQIGRPPRERRAELEAALRLHAYLAMYESRP